MPTAGPVDGTGEAGDGVWARAVAVYAHGSVGHVREGRVSSERMHMCKGLVVATRRGLSPGKSGLYGREPQGLTAGVGSAGSSGALASKDSGKGRGQRKGRSWQRLQDLFPDLAISLEGLPV